VPVVSPNPDVDIRPVSFLGFLAACTPTAFLIALHGAGGTVWHGRWAQAVLSVSGALICGVIAAWLARECRLSGHPALAALSDGFVGSTVISLAAVFVQTSSHMMALQIFSMSWAMIFGTQSVLFLNLRGLRHKGRDLLSSSRYRFHLLELFAFLALAGIFLLLDESLFHRSEYRSILRATIFLVAGATLPLLLVSSFRIYLRKGNPVILFFSQGLYLHTLGILGQTVAPQWSIPWWFSQGLGTISVFAIAYGVVEANRVRDRWQLIKTLGTRSEELQKSHADLVDSEARYRSLVDNAPYGIYRLNGAERFDAVNAAFLQILGLHPGTSLEQMASFPAVFRVREEYEEFMQELKETGRVQDELMWNRGNGTYIKVRLDCRRVSESSFLGTSYEGIVEDLSEQTSLEEQLRQSQKMEAIGRLAGGIAHDFNNLLTIISGYTGILMDTLTEQDPRRDDAERIKNASHRAADLTRQLLAFSRKQVLSPTTLNLNDAIADLLKILPRLVGEDIDLAFVPAKRASLVYADRAQIEQVLMNLIVNARDAMPDGGKITIELKHQKLENRDTRRRRGMIPGEYVMLAVSDTGCGMDAATQARVFEPFFTTKREGKGTGLGLATVYGIVKQSGGHISLYSEPAHGTVFKVYFPARAGKNQVNQLPVAARRPSMGETVLVVEDEIDLRKMIVRALERVGYRVLEATGGEQALALVEGSDSKLDLLITDVVMPGIRGTEVAQKLSQSEPELKVLYMSGYTDNAMFHQKLLGADVAFIQKPFTLEALEQKVADMLQPDRELAADD
jgi:PAS domain S-box-containing protein